MLVSVALNVPVETLFTYRVPKGLENEVSVGKRVIVPFGRNDRLTTGIIVKVSHDNGDKNLKNVLEIPDKRVLFPEQLINLSRWIAKRYGAYLGEVIFFFLPKRFFSEQDVLIRPSGGQFSKKLGVFEKEIYIAVSERGPRGISLKQLKRKLKRRSVYQGIYSLYRKGLLTIENSFKLSSAPREIFVRLKDPSKAKGKYGERIAEILSSGERSLKELVNDFHIPRDALRRAEKNELVEFLEKEKDFKPKPQGLKDERQIELTPAQKKALEEILLGKKLVTLLSGVTGSGKMEVYLQAAQKIYNEGKSVLILVPELLLTPELRARVEAYFGKEIGIYHGKMTESERASAWLAAAEGRRRIFLGTRSALALPLKNLGLIIVDEEQDSSYKEQQKPYHSAKDSAIKRAEIEGAKVILVSATPSVESYYKAKEGLYGFVELKERVLGTPLPFISVVDLRNTNTYGLFSEKLVRMIEATLQKGEQVLLFLNKRGFYASGICPNCGYRIECERCSVPLVYHKSEGKLLCHICSKSYEPVYKCPKCSSRLIFKGHGTERVEQEVRQLFPSARVVRFDQDSVKNPLKAAELIRAAKEGEFDIIIGTQIISKGHNFPKLSLVAVLLAESSYTSPDFRADERIFQAIVHTTGRSGRFKLGGAVVQTYNPEIPAVKYACNYEFDKFFESEIEVRELLGYPPFSFPILFEVQIENRAELPDVEVRFRRLKVLLEDFAEVPELTPAPISKAFGRYRFISFIRTFSESDLYRSVEVLRKNTKNLFSKYRTKFVVEPDAIM